MPDQDSIAPLRSMPNVVALLMVVLIPVAFFPGWFFYYDVTPKGVVMLAGSAWLCAWTAWARYRFGINASNSIETSQSARWNGRLTGAFVIVTIVSTAASPYVSLAWTGSNWRRWGAALQIATAISALLISSIASRSRSALLLVLHGICAAGVIVSLYAISQYLGWDPLVSALQYQFGEGPYRIVRPPSTMGHSNYLAAFLLWPIFAGGYLFRSEASPWGRYLSGSATLLALTALILCGSRGALLGLIAGAMTLLLILRPQPRKILIGAGVLVLAVGAFYVSPPGAQLRARVFWVGEDSAGGSRLLLWRDSLRMAALRPWTGFGPDTFVVEFPRVQSAELSRPFPDFYHESPHNMFLDTLVSDGIPGVVVLIGWIALAFYAGHRTLQGEHRLLSAILLAGLVATLVAHQFAVLVIPTAFLFLLSLGLLTALEKRETEALPHTTFAKSAAMNWATASILLGACAYQLAGSDLRLAHVQRLLDAGNTETAAVAWNAAQPDRHAVFMPGISADIYFSRRWSAASASATALAAKAQFAQLAANAAVAATQVPEQQANAWYSLAMLQAAANNPHAVETSLRAAIYLAPTWFKPHWSLARLLHAAGHAEEARHEARLALDLDGNHDREVIDTTSEILRSATATR